MRILFVCGSYYPKPSANGVCVIRLQEALYKNNIQSDVICIGEKEEAVISQFGETIVLEDDCTFLSKTRFQKLCNKIKLLFIWPVKSEKVILAYNNAIQQQMSKYNYDAVVSVLRPIEGALACLHLRNVILYELDSITNNGENLYGIKKILSNRAYKIENRIYQNAKKIIHLKCHEQYYSQEQYRQFKHKFIFTDIPHLISREVSKSKDNGVIDMIYAGSMTRYRNSPEYAIRLIKTIAKINRIKCEFYSRGDCENLVFEESKGETNVIEQMGYVSQDVLEKACMDADIFLSIGFHHKGTVTSIPSKIFEYMSTGKMILHIYGGENDTAIEYLNKYENAIIIYPDEDININAARVVDFYVKHKDTKVDINTLRNLFPMNTPEWTASKLISIIENLKE